MSTRLSNLRRPRPCALRVSALALALIATSQAGCLACNDIGCGGGFDWSASTTDGDPIRAGTYAFEITLDATRFELECTIADTVGDSHCTDPTRVEGDRDFTISFGLSHATPHTWDPDGPTGGFYFMAADTSGSSEDGSYSATDGPNEVHIVVRYDGQLLIDVDYEITYVRDKAYRGDERCGYCDELELRDASFAY